MNPGPIVWGLVGGIAVLGLRWMLSRLEHGRTILPSFNFSKAKSRDDEEALIATIILSSGDMGGENERRRILELEHQLSEAIERSSTGEFDGDEFGGGTCTIYMYGPCAEKLFAVAWPILTAFHAPSGSYVTKRSGNSETDRIPLVGQ